MFPIQYNIRTSPRHVRNLYKIVGNSTGIQYVLVLTVGIKIFKQGYKIKGASKNLKTSSRSFLCPDLTIQKLKRPQKSRVTVPFRRKCHKIFQLGFSHQTAFLFWFFSKTGESIKNVGKIIIFSN